MAEIELGRIGGIQVFACRDALAVEADVLVLPLDVALVGGDFAARAIRSEPALRRKLDGFFDAADGKIWIGQTIGVSGVAMNAPKLVAAINSDADRERLARSNVLHGLFARALDHADHLKAKHVVFPARSESWGSEADTVLRTMALALQFHTRAPTGIETVTLELAEDNDLVVRELLERSGSDRVPMIADLAASRLPAMRNSIVGATALRPDEQDSETLLISAATDGFGVLRERLVTEGIALPEGAIGVADQLRQLRNEVAHSKDPSAFSAGVRNWLLANGLIAHTDVLRQYSELLSTPTKRPDAIDRRGRWRAAYEIVASPWFDASVLKALETADVQPTKKVVASLPADFFTSIVASPIIDAGGTPVGRLQQLLDKYLEERERAALWEAVAGEQHFEGDDETRLIEFLLDRDPDDLLTNTFSGAAIRDIAKAECSLSAAEASNTELAVQRILEHLGFTICATPTGLAHYDEKLRELRNKVRRARDSTVVAGAIAEGGALMERLLKLLLKFHIRHAFAGEPDAILKDLEILEASRKFATSSLGALLYFVHEVDKKLHGEQHSAARARHQQLFGDRRILYDKKTEIAALRNQFAHDRDEISAMSVSAARLQADKFFGATEKWILHLQESPRLLPMVVSITEIRTDRWGRRMVTCDTEDGEEEILFTDVQLELGERYFMYPKSNPVRVFPILVRA